MNKATQALAAARLADPQARPWGLYLAPLESGEDGLCWFSSPEALLGFVSRELWPALSGVDCPPDAARSLAALAQAPALHWELLDSLNQVLDPVAQIHWWGSLRQLFEGEDPFAKDLREAWRQDVGRGPQDFSALSPAEQAQFCAFLRTVFAQAGPADL
ncbi:MAG TPA: hypothetical protein VNZ54_02825 [bacterium]|nr:hypothetical protein [bacterium]HXB96957.1 hypothetical protein [bacterium]HXC65505.1 hypothetical protein [bacterium]